MSWRVTAHLPGQGAVSQGWPLGALGFAAPVLCDTNLLTCVEVTGDEVASRRKDRVGEGETRDMSRERPDALVLK